VIASCQHELRVGQSGVGRIDSPGVVLAEISDSGMIAPVKRAEEILCLMPDVAQVRPRREVTSGQDEPPSRLPGVRLRRA
jgi:hypothetical protein